MWMALWKKAFMGLVASFIFQGIQLLNSNWFCHQWISSCKFITIRSTFIVEADVGLYLAWIWVLPHCHPGTMNHRINLKEILVTHLQLPVSEIGTLLLNLRNALCFSRPYQTRLIDSTGIFVWMQVSWMICLTIFCSSMYRHFYNPDAKRPAALKGKEIKLFPYSNLSILCWKILGTFSRLHPHPFC